MGQQNEDGHCHNCTTGTFVDGVCDFCGDELDPNQGGDNDGEERFCDACGDWRPIEDGCCARCGFDINTADANADLEDDGEWCDNCGDWKPVEDGRCLRCGEEIE